MFNKAKKRCTAKKVQNEEGYEVFRMKDDQALFLTASSFTPRNSFYNSNKTLLENFEALLRRMIVTEPVFVTALAWYLGKVMGVRLSPVIMAANLAEKGNSIQKIVHDVFTRPDFIANFLAYWKDRIFVLNNLPKEVFVGLKRQLSSFNELTLKRRKMLNREFKLKDLIKILKPQPKDSKMSLLYRAIIEDSKASKLQTVVNKETGVIEKSEHTTAAISSDKVSHKEKQAFVQKNVKDLPINSLIKNLSFLTADQAPALKARLTSLFKSGNGLRFINPFDLVFMESLEHDGYNQRVRVPDEIMNACDEVLKEFVTFNCPAKKPVILYDRSGSMMGGGHLTGSKFLSMMTSIFEKDFRFYTFASSGGGYGWDNRDRTRSSLPAAIEDMTSKFKAPGSFLGGPNQAARFINNHIRCSGCTQLMEAMEWTVTNNPEMDLFVIVTDEATWADPYQIEAYRRIIPEHLAGKVLLINVAPAQKSVFKPTAKVVRISGLDGKIIKMIEALVDFDSFKQKMIRQYEDD